MTTASAPSVSAGLHLEDLFARIDPLRGRLIFALDATASRQPTWDRAAQLQGKMFETVAAIGGLDIQLLYFRGWNECVASRWFCDGKSLASTMSRITCAAGHTQIRRVLHHARKTVNALILISDACEELPAELYGEARELTVPVFLFQEGSDERVAEIYREIAAITGGASCSFDSGVAQRLADLLKAVAAFATGGVKALANQSSEAARLLLTQIKKKSDAHADYFCR